ncbi:MAG: hypothetical protein Q4C10_04640 [Clostridia bacterium]|nr:hypothetical protein [Clostridia bacterium]
MKLWTLCPEGTPDCLASSGACKRFITQREYGEEAFARIRAEADGYEILTVESWGNDYGYGNDEDNLREETMPVSDQRIVVSEDGARFAGVTGESSYSEFNKSSHIEKGPRVTLTSDPVDGYRNLPLIYKTGSSFSSDDHSRWDYTYYYLRKRES